MKKIKEVFNKLIFAIIVVAGMVGAIMVFNNLNTIEVTNQQTLTPEVITEEKVTPEYEALIKQAQEEARAEIEASAQVAYDETYSFEMDKIEAQVLAEYADKIDAMRAEKQSVVDSYWRDLSSIKKLIRKKANEYGVSASTMMAVINCESQYHPSIQSKHVYTETNVPQGYRVGDREQSFGLVQIHLPAHRSVTKAEAIDPEFAVDFLAKNLAQGQGSMWSCYKTLAMR